MPHIPDENNNWMKILREKIAIGCEINECCKEKLKCLWIIELESCGIECNDENVPALLWLCEGSNGKYRIHTYRWSEEEISYTDTAIRKLFKFI